MDDVCTRNIFVEVSLTCDVGVGVLFVGCVYARFIKGCLNWGGFVSACVRGKYAHLLG